MSNPLLGPVLAFAQRLRFPTLFALVATIFFVDLLIPDFIPFVDELMLGLGTILLANLKRRREPEARPPIEGEANKP
ncbi:DUF6116 family protein [Arenimonas sp.]|uniref:DUF6116 family protein n=1 Tax=Arenimonas sp. TaxID=1872635 RepID=UPI0039E2FCA4